MHEFNLQHGRKCFDGYGKIDICGGVTAAVHRIAAPRILCVVDSRGPKKIGAASEAEHHSTARRGPILARQPRLFTGPPQP
jgi:hypothetical protein